MRIVLWPPVRMTTKTGCQKRHNMIISGIACHRLHRQNARLAMISGPMGEALRRSIGAKEPKTA